ncbi:MAG: DUF4157 domain-containing protein [Myxococcota bacterium]
MQRHQTTYEAQQEASFVEPQALAPTWKPLMFNKTLNTTVQMRRASGITGLNVMAFREHGALQMKQASDNPSFQDAHTIAQHGLRGSPQPLPHLSAIQRSFGDHDVSTVQAHLGSQALEANAQLGSVAYATGNAVAFGRSPDLHTAAHEAAHIIQQRSGVVLEGGIGQVGDRHEQHADAVADAVVQGKSAQPMLDMYTRGGSAYSTASVQRLQLKKDPKGKPSTVEEAKYWFDQANTIMGTLANAVGTVMRHKDLPSKARGALTVTQQRLNTFKGQLSRYAKTADKAAKANTFLTVASGVWDFVKAAQDNDTVGMATAAGDLMTHVVMGSNPITAVLDGVLSLIFGGDWPSKAAAFLINTFIFPKELIEGLSKFVKQAGHLLKATSHAVRTITNSIAREIGDAIDRTIDGLVDPKLYQAHPKYRPVEGAPTSGEVTKAISTFMGAVKQSLDASFKKMRRTKGKRLTSNQILNTLFLEPVQKTLKTDKKAMKKARTALEVLHQALLAKDPKQALVFKTPYDFLRYSQRDLLDVLSGQQLIDTR